ncbi:hypothetical protein GIB67_000050 [Kingdonia uniflora]|uniref:Uncharacterized protein n=1 Tax=Kingdonia uniflora TaxID=39325 RepID=A0A7J7LTM7_9MAGN|nr:hypothetical protein GIB67_000050 [Kingdonia uniflora]
MDILRGFRAELEEDRRIQITLWFRRKEMIIKLTLEGLTIMENRTVDIIQETRKLHIIKKGSPLVVQNQSVDVCNNPQQQQPQVQTDQETQLKASHDVVMAMAMAAKSKLLLWELKTVKTDLAFAKERCAQLEEENRILWESRAKGDNPKNNDLTNYAWKIILMFGAIPVAMTFFSRMKMPETAKYIALVAKDAKQVAADMSKVLQVEIEAKLGKVEKSSNSFGLFSMEFFHRHGLHLLGTTSTLFLLEIAFYSQNLFQKDNFSAIGWIPAANIMNAIEEVFKIARAQTLIALYNIVAPRY